jgi:hypothetical protein
MQWWRSNFSHHEDLCFDGRGTSTPRVTQDERPGAATLVRRSDEAVGIMSSQNETRLSVRRILFTYSVTIEPRITT